MSDCVRRRFKSRARETSLWRETKRNHPLLSRRRRRRKRGREGDRNTSSFFLSSPSILNIIDLTTRKKKRKKQGGERGEKRERERITRATLSLPRWQKKETYLGDGLVLELTGSLGELRELGSL